MKILFAASECAPLAKVGGLADVVGSLPRALKKEGIDVQLVLPFYEIIKIKSDLAQKDIPLFFDGKEDRFDLYKTHLPRSKVPLYLVKHKSYFRGGVYLTEDASSEGGDMEATRFLFFSLAAVKTAKLVGADIIHCHDWHVGIMPWLLKDLSFKTLFTIHNLAYQGLYVKDTVNRLLGANFSKDINCLEMGILNANLINTVSENYAKEILTPQFGCGLEKSLQKRQKDLTGVLNGIDYEQFHPSSDNFIEKKYSKLSGKEENKKALQRLCFKKEGELPLIGIISRLAEQKGFDLIKKVLPKLVRERLQIILLGKGMKEYEAFFLREAKKHPEKLFVKIGFDEELAHKIYAGSDMFLMPSRFEPCGLGQMIAMKYGSLPIVRATGGLKDTVLRGKTGFLFENYNEKQMVSAIKDALEVFGTEKWKRMQKEAMKQDFSWKSSAQKYIKLYKKLLKIV